MDDDIPQLIGFVLIASAIMLFLFGFTTVSICHVPGLCNSGFEMTSVIELLAVAALGLSGLALVIDAREKRIQ